MTSASRPRLRWYAAGDVNAFFGLALDNLTQLVILSSLLIGLFKFPADLVLFRMIPGTALGVLVGDLAYTWLAVKLARRTGREDVTAMPFGIDTPSLFGVVFGVLGPVMLLTHDPHLAWRVGMGVTVAMGGVKLLLSLGGDWVRRVVPRAALLGSIAGVAILLIAFLPALKIFADPLVGLVSLAVLLVALVGKRSLPARLPGAFAAVVVGTAIFWGRQGLGLGGPGHPVGAISTLTLTPPLPTLAWLDALEVTLPYLSVAIPFALATIIGGIDNTESAIAVGDEYRTRDILLTEAVATVIAGACGGVIQNTPYIGHPAYKAMGARAGYTLATGLVVGVGAMVGVVALLVGLLPEAAVAPILVFIGLEITAQAFLASPARHAPAVAISFLPAVATLLLIQEGSLLASVGKGFADLGGEARAVYQTLLILGNGFILTALLWGCTVAFIIDGRLRLAGVVFAVASVATLFGIIHSPLPNGALVWPWTVESTIPAVLAGSYGVVAGICWLLGDVSPGQTRKSA
ncbi:MAG: MFS transporter [Candidatus Rokubacteria bacterium]|nr:MFS transporter [Candidatus Rokubacteria bacterium]